MGRNRKKRGNKKSDANNNNTRTYLKVFASFKCSKDNCGKTWNSAHGWEREDDGYGINCDYCNNEAELLNAVDEILKLISYNCISCENYWQEIDNGNLYPKECDLCHLMVDPEQHPQERFGRHYWFKCKNQNCPAGPVNLEWEDFSTDPQKTQRCSKCFNHGLITKVQKLKRPPLWILIRRNKNRSGDHEDDGPRGPTSHIPAFCDMCQDIIRQGKGKSCRQWKKVVCEVVQDADGILTEKIVDLSQDGMYATTDELARDFANLRP